MAQKWRASALARSYCTHRIVEWEEMCNALDCGRRVQKDVSEVILVPDKIITDEQGLYSSGGPTQVSA